MILKSLCQPSPNPGGMKSAAVGLSCWGVAVASIPSLSVWFITLSVNMSIISFMADYVARYSYWAVIDRYAAISFGLFLFVLAPWILRLASLVLLGFFYKSRTASDKENWVTWHCSWHLVASIWILLITLSPSGVSVCHDLK